jgi:nucleotide-binding universal stress UspA family protein
MPSPKRILVPVDFSACSRAALEHALDLQAALGAEVEVLHVHEPSGFVGFESCVLMPVDRPARRWEQLRNDLLHELERFLAPHRGRIGQVRVEAGVPSDVIPDLARRGEFDLVLMGTHGQSGFSRLVVGNVAEGVMRKAHCPVMTLRMPMRGGGRESVLL